MTQDFLRQAALAWYDAGCSIWPPVQDGSKRPAGEWKGFTRAPAPRNMIENLYTNAGHQGVGLICGKVSGNLEMLELEGEATDSSSLDLLLEQAEARGVRWLWERLANDGYAEWTPSGGLHMIYRIHDHEVPGNTKIARRPATPEELGANPDHKIVTLSETRGEGGYVVVAPSGGPVHETGDSWSTFAGRIGIIPHITWADRCSLHEAIHAALDRMPQREEFTPTRPPAPRQLPMDAARPGDDFSLRTDWHDILEPHGWRVHHTTMAETFWTRPGKKRSEGWSATTGFAGSGLDDRLYVWSSSTVFDTEKPYTKFGAYTLLEHGGDFQAAARSLASRGYGSARPAVVAPGAVPPAPPAPIQPALEAQAAQRAVAPGPASTSLRRRDKEGIPIIDQDFFGSFDWNDIAVCTAFAQSHQDTVKAIPKDNAWMFWQDTHWVADDRTRANLAASRFVEGMLAYARTVQRTDDARGKELVKIANRLGGIRNVAGIAKLASCQPELAMVEADFDADPNLMTLRNGILNIKTMQLEPHDPLKLCTKVVNASYDPSKTTGRFTEFMEQVLPDPAVRDYFQRAVGYALTGEADQRAIFLMHGESGTGKTQTLEALATVLGDFAATAPGSAFKPRQEGYKGPSEDLHKLKGKRFVIQSELDQGTQLNEGLVKAITGGDTQSTRDLYRSSQEWRPEYVVFMATNYLPRVSSSDNAIWKRFKPIKFEQVFIDGDGMPSDKEAANLGRKMAAAEPEVILNWILEGLAKYREHGLKPPAQVGDWLTAYRDETDSIRQFLIEGEQDGILAVGEGQESGARELYNAYNAWCQDNHIKPFGSTNFRQRMESSGWRTGRTAKGKRWFGVGLANGAWIVGAQRPVGFPDVGWGKRE